MSYEKYEKETLKNSENSEKKAAFIEENKFQEVRQCQQEILKAIEVCPSIRKIMNDLITKENLEKVKNKYLGIFVN